MTFARTIALASLAAAMLATPVIGASIRVTDGVLVIEGEIHASDPSNVRGTVEVNVKHPVRSIQITSPGGDTIASIELGRVIRKLGLPVHAVGKCYSGCAYVYLGARHATTDKPVLGHGISGPVTKKRLNALAQVERYLTEIGYSRYFDDVAASTAAKGEKPTFVVKR